MNGSPRDDKRLKNYLTWIAASIAVFHVYANTLGTISDLWRNALHFGLLGGLGFILYPPSEKRNNKRLSSFFGWILGILCVLCAFYLILFENALHERNEVPVPADLIFAGLAILLALELVQRTSGYVIPSIAVFFLTYVLWWGQYLGGVFALRSMSLARVLYRMYFTDEGLFGMIATISSTYIFMFMLFAAFLLKSGGGDFIIRLARSLTHRITGGPALVAVVSSGLMGTISGSAVANAVSTGAITIPMMKKSGYAPRFAAAVETAASTGGQIMPPIMGAGAFIMAQWTQIPYATIIGAAVLPALLYFFSIGFSVYLESKKLGLEKREMEDAESAAKVLKEGLPFLIPILILIGMLAAGYTPTYTAGFAILSVVVSSWLSPKNRMGIGKIVEALALGTRNMAATGILLVSTGIIVGTINMTGISITFSQMVVDWSGASILLALLLITFASLFLGMGLPVTAAYIMIAILTAPSLTSMGISLLAAHMIIFWLSQDSNVTPPVCLAAFAASSIAGSRPMATGLTSWRLAKGLYIMPLLFAFTGLIDGTWTDRMTVFGFSLAGLFVFSASATGFWARPLSILSRFLLLIIAFGLFWPSDTRINVIALAAAVFFFITGRVRG